MVFLISCSNSSEDVYDANYSPDILRDINDVLTTDILPDIFDVNSQDNLDYKDIFSDESELDSAFEVDGVLDDIEDIEDIKEDTGVVPELTPELIGFENKELPQKGSMIFYNNWSMGDGKDSVEMMSPDGSYKAIRLYANRVWSFGVNKTGNIVVFSTNDPFQSERYGINVYDAIENTWLLKDNEPLKQITYGAINDECHTFINDEILMMCRRANFRPDPNYMVIFDPYRILFHNLNNHNEVFLTPLDARYNDYSGSIRDDGVILFNRNIIADRTIDIMSINPLSGEINLILEDASNPVVSNDGTQVLFKKRGQNKIFLSSSYDLTNAIAIIDGGNSSIGRYVFSPDRLQIAYTLDDRTNNCADLMIASKDGSNIRKLLDCSDEKKFITVINWVYVE